MVSASRASKAMSQPFLNRVKLAKVSRYVLAVPSRSILVFFVIMPLMKLNSVWHGGSCLNADTMSSVV